MTKIVQIPVGWLLVDPEDLVDGEDVDLFMDAAPLSDYDGTEQIEVNGHTTITPLPLFVAVVL
jgi:hypothetical protein